MTVHFEPPKVKDTRLPDPHQDTFSKVVFGFWTYLMTDCLLFATLFATYAVLRTETFGGPSSQDLFEVPTVFFETFVLLFSSLTCGIALLSIKKGRSRQALFWLALTFLLGALFVMTELHEFRGLIAQGHTWQKSAFLSSFFTLVGTHGFHVSVGLLWLVVLTGQLLAQGVTSDTFRRLVCFSLFWHFLDLIWIFIFTFVYLLGVV